MNYSIIATLGPASTDEATWHAMLSAGATAFRLNTSHLSLAQLETWLERYSAFAAHPPLVLDLQGSKWRLGDFPAFTLAEGQTVELIHAAQSAAPGVLPVPHADFFRALPASSGEIVLNDAKSRLKVESAGAESVRARVTLGGLISAHKGITFSASTYRTEALSHKDQAIFDLSKDLPRIQYAVSYIKDGAEMARYRSLFGPNARLVAKLERGPAIQDAVQIAAHADSLWVCRGDLGAELGLRGMAEAVADFTAQVRSLPVPAIMAGQVLEHLTTQPTPTRSEVCYLYDTLQAGYHGFVLSDETAVGNNPVEACRVAALCR